MTRVRIVDDSELLAEMLRDLLVHEGHGVTITTHDFGSLLNPDAWLNVEVALIDLYLAAEISGFDILDYLQRNHPDIRRVVLSGSSNDPTLEHHVHEYAHVVLPKPTNVDDVIAALVAP